MRILTFTLVLGSTYCGPALIAQAKPDDAITIGRNLEVESKILGETRRIMVAVPEGYERNERRYGVLYLLDGEQFFTSTVGAVRHNARSYPPLIVVGIRNTKRTRDLTPKETSGKDARPGSGGSKDFRRFLVEELRPFLRKQFRTNGMSVLVGHSFGGLFAVDTMLEQPDAFTAYLALSPSLWWDDRKLVARLKELPRDHRLFDHYVYTSMGEEAEVMNPPFEEVAWHWKAKAPARFRYDVGRFPGKSHWTVVPVAIYEGLMAYFAPIETLNQGKGIASLAELERRCAELSKRYGTKIEIQSQMLGMVAQQIAASGKVDAGLEMIDAGTKRFAKDPMMQVMRGQILEDAGRFDEAIAVYEQTIKTFAKGAPGLATFLQTRLDAAQAKKAKATGK